MKNAIILHGTGDKNTSFWFPYIKKLLEKRGYAVWTPQMPSADKPNLKDWLPFVINQGKFSRETILIGHSAGAQLILSILEQLKLPIKQAVLVSGYSRPLRKSRESKSVGKFNWKKISSNCRQFTFINSDNDPWGCDDKQGRIMLEKLGGILVIPKGEGHMGSTTLKQSYKKFPLLAKLLEY